MVYHKKFILPPQLHLEAWDYSLEKEHFKPIENFYHYPNRHDFDEPMNHRPYGGLWTSTYHETHGSDWFQFNIHGKYGGIFPSNHIMHSFLLVPSPKAKVYVLDSYYDLELLMYCYQKPIEKGKRKKTPFLNFERLSKEYDALHLTKNGLYLLEETEPYCLRYWDCESTIWFNFNHFSSIEHLGQKEYKKDPNYKNAPVLPRQKKKSFLLRC